MVNTRTASLVWSESVAAEVIVFLVTSAPLFLSVSDLDRPRRSLARGHPWRR
jgi:hypothetical protein